MEWSELMPTNVAFAAINKPASESQEFLTAVAIVLVLITLCVFSIAASFMNENVASAFEVLGQI
jgi:hypothetical protein